MVALDWMGRRARMARVDDDVGRRLVAAVRARSTSCSPRTASTPCMLSRVMDLAQVASQPVLRALARVVPYAARADANSVSGIVQRTV